MDKVTKYLLFAIAIGVWGLFLQNIGLIGKISADKVYITGGEIDAVYRVRGTVDVSIDNSEVPIRIESVRGKNGSLYYFNNN